MVATNGIRSYAMIDGIKEKMSQRKRYLVIKNERLPMVKLTFEERNEMLPPEELKKLRERIVINKEQVETK